MGDERTGSAKDLGAMALVSAGTLVLEVAYTRLLSVVVWYHMAFVCVSLALLGLGAPGCWFAIRPPGERTLERALLAGALLVPASVAAILRWGRPNFGDMALLIVASLLPPFLFLGASVVLLFMRAPARLFGKYYAADLLGAAAGASVVVPLLKRVPTPLLVAGAAILPLAALLLTSGRRALWPTIGVGVLVAGTLVQGSPYQVTYTKSYDERGPSRPIYEKWTPTARLAVFDRAEFLAPLDAGFLWGAGTTRPPKPRAHLWIEQDGSAGTPITKFGGSLEEVSDLLDDVTSVAYQLRHPTTAAIIGPGGGRDILAAFVAGVTDVEAVELNAGIVDVVDGRFRAFSGGVYHLPHVHTVVSEGRSHLARSQKRYDVVQISMIDSWAATAAGAYALSENNLYTVDAFELFLDRLSPAGIVSATRWAQGSDFFETTRLAMVAREALRRRGVEQPRDHVVVLRADQVATVLVSAKPFSAEDLTALRSVAAARGFEILHPGARNPVAEALASGTGAIAQRTHLDYSPTTDDRPFFFFRHSVFQFANRPAQVASLHAAVGATAYVALLLFLLPFTRWRFIERRGLARGSGYFVAIGVAFMLIEAPLIQRFVLYLGHPSYATTVVLSSLLLGAGLGSMNASRPDAGNWPLGTTLVVLPGLSVALPVLFRETLGASFAVRVVVSALALSSTGFLLGHWLPAGMRRFDDASRPWFWAMNGVASVLATALSVPLAIAFGFGALGFFATALYGVAWLLVRGALAPASVTSRA